MSEVVLTFAREAQAEGPLREAAYRLAALAACQVDWQDGRWTCRLAPTPHGLRKGLTDETLRAHFLAVLNDENLRERVGRETRGLRDVMVALAFGSLAREARPVAGD